LILGEGTPKDFNVSHAELAFIDSLFSGEEADRYVILLHSLLEGKQYHMEIYEGTVTGSHLILWNTNNPFGFLSLIRYGHFFIIILRYNINP